MFVLPFSSLFLHFFLDKNYRYYQGPMFGTYVWPDKEYNPLGISTNFLKYVVQNLDMTSCIHITQQKQIEYEQYYTYPQACLKHSQRNKKHLHLYFSPYIVANMNIWQLHLILWRQPSRILLCVSPRNFFFNFSYIQLLM